MKNKNLLTFLVVFSAIQLHAGVDVPPAAPSPSAPCNWFTPVSLIVSGAILAFGIGGLAASNHHHHDRNCCTNTTYCNRSQYEDGQIGGQHLVCNSQGPGRYTFCTPNPDAKDPKWAWPLANAAGVALGVGAVLTTASIFLASRTCCLSSGGSTEPTVVAVNQP